MLRSFSAGAVVCGTLLVAGASLCQAAEKAPLPADDQASRELVRQALVAETAGDNTLRARKLSQAVLAAPDLDAANWHLARIQQGGKWLPLAQAEEAAAADPDAIEYRKRRVKAASHPKLLRDLARYCTRLGWSETAQLHYAQLLGQAAATKEMREEAVERLELVQSGGAWVTKDEVAARDAEAQAIQDSLVKWRPKLKALQQVIDGPDFAKRDKAIEQLQQLDDPQMIPALESFLLDGKAQFQEQAVKRLATLPHYEATEALVRYAVLPDSVIVRDVAIEALKQRPLEDICPLLLEGLESRLQSRFQINVDAKGNVHYSHTLFSNDRSENRVWLSRQMFVPLVVRTSQRYSNPKIPGNFRITSGESRVDRAIETARTKEIAAQAVESNIRRANSAADQNNRTIFAALKEITGQQFPEDPANWWSWWHEYNEYHWPKGTTYVWQNKYVPYVIHQHTISKMSCFLAGTPVRTQAGLAAIETIQPGDRVLSQDQNTGELNYKLVLRTTLRPPAKMVRIAAGSESITTTLGHPFWVSGHGWKMAKELKAGDRLHSHGGAVEIAAIEELAKPEPAHNLVVADFNSYFVGNQGLLVHDNEFRQPTRAIVPGLTAQ